MNKKIVKPGDIIRVTKKDSVYEGNWFVVIVCPDLYKGSCQDAPDHVWIDSTGKGGWVFFDNYGEGWFEIIQTKSTADNDTDVDKFQRRQRDDNLARAFG